jgi:hypothetical protein
VATKVLHKRRPKLIPILDNEAIFGAYMNPKWPEKLASTDSVYAKARIARRLRSAHRVEHLDVQVIAVAERPIGGTDHGAGLGLDGQYGRVLRRHGVSVPGLAVGADDDNRTRILSLGIVTEAGGVAVLRRALNGQSWPGVPHSGRC